MEYRTLNWGIVVGVNYSRNLFYELGITKSKLEDDSIFYSGDVTFEFEPLKKIYGFNLYAYMYSKKKTKRIVYRNKVSNFLWTSMIWGLNLNAYTDQKNFNIGFRPLLGLSGNRIGLPGLQLFYSYNILFWKQTVPGLNRHFVTLRYNLPVFKKKEKILTFQGNFIDIDR